MFGGSLTADPVVAVQHQQRVSVEVFDVLNPFRVEVSGAFDSGDASFSLGPDIPELERSTAVQKGLELLGGDLPNASRGVGHVGDVGILQLEGPGGPHRRSRCLQLGEQPRDVARQGIDTQVDGRSEPLERGRAAPSKVRRAG